MNTLQVGSNTTTKCNTTKFKVPYVIQMMTVISNSNYEFWYYSSGDSFEDQKQHTYKCWKYMHNW